MVAVTYGFFGVSLALALGTFGLPSAEAYGIFILLGCFGGVEKARTSRAASTGFLVEILLLVAELLVELPQGFEVDERYG